MVGGYVNGRYKWQPADWARFGGAVQFRINVTGVWGRGNILDVERGDATPGDAPHWYDSITWLPPRERGIYCNRATLPAVIAAMGKRDWRLWLATLDGTVPAVVDGREVDAVQYASTSEPWHADWSVVLNGAWRRR
jgi:hypothetical protein